MCFQLVGAGVRLPPGDPIQPEPGASQMRDTLASLGWVGTTAWAYCFLWSGEGAVALQAFPFRVRQSDFQSSVCSGLPSSQCSNIPALVSEAPAKAPLTGISAGRGCGCCTSHFLGKSSAYLLLLAPAPRSVILKFWEESILPPRSKPGKGHCSPRVLERQCGHWVTDS